MEKQKRKVKISKKKSTSEQILPISSENTLIQENPNLTSTSIRVEYEMNMKKDFMSVLKASEAAFTSSTTLCLKFDGKSYTYTRTKAEYNNITSF